MINQKISVYFGDVDTENSLLAHTCHTVCPVSTYQFYFTVDRKFPTSDHHQNLLNKHPGKYN